MDSYRTCAWDFYNYILLYTHWTNLEEMKTKLLRKVRKRFSIRYYPNGYKNQYYDINCPVIITFDNEGSFFERMEYTLIKDDITYEKAFEKQYKYLIKRILKVYEDYGTRRNSFKSKSIKLWYNPSK